MAGAPPGVIGRWAAANPGSARLHAQASAVLPGGVTHDVRRADPFPVAVEQAAGAHKRTVDGQDLVCYVMGHGALLLGHGHPAVVAALRRQAERFLHPGANHDIEVRWAELVVELVPSAERVRFTSSGTEATMLALRIARAMTGRRRVAKLAGHFHGWHDQMAWGADPPFDGPDSAGLPPGGADAVLVLPAEVTAVEAALRTGDVAALILEPTGAAWGTVPLDHDVLAGIRRAATAAGTVLIFDEVVSGFRWSPGGVQGVAGVVPDLTALGKVLAGGMPGGAVAGRADLVDNLALPDADGRRVSHPGTHNAHPMAAAAGVATLELLRSGELQSAAAATAGDLRDGLRDVLHRRGVAGAVYGESSTFHLLLGVDGSPAGLDPARVKEGPGRRAAAALQCAMLLEGVHLFHGSGFVSVAHGGDETERTVAAFDRSLGALLGEGLL